MSAVWFGRRASREWGNHGPFRGSKSFPERTLVFTFRKPAGEPAAIPLPGDAVPVMPSVLTMCHGESRSDGQRMSAEKKEQGMPETGIAVVLAHGGWADGSSWNEVIAGPRSKGVKAVAAPLPMTTLADDMAMLDHVLERLDGPVVVARAYAGAVIGSTVNEKVASLVYVAALAPDEGETVGDVYYWAEHHVLAPRLGPDRDGLIWLPEDAFAAAFAQHASPVEQALLAATQRRLASASPWSGRFGRTGPAGSWWPKRTG
jgi:hypothetical protein